MTPREVLGLQATAGNAATVQLLRERARPERPVVQRDGTTGTVESVKKASDETAVTVKKVSDGTATSVKKVSDETATSVKKTSDDTATMLKKASDETMLAVLLSSWDSGVRTAVASHLGTERLKTLISKLGSSVGPKLDPAALLQIPISGTGVPSLQAVAVAVAKAGGKADDIISVGRSWASPLQEMLGALLTFRVGMNVLTPLIVAATTSERSIAASDSQLMTVAKANLTADDYLALLPALGVYNKPTTTTLAEGGAAHMSATDADKLIQSQLVGYLAGAVKAGRKVEGEVSVVDDADFQMAFDRQWVATGLQPKGSIAKNTCNAFVDVNLPKRHIWVHRDLGNLGTVVHEGMHKYADPTLRNEQMTLVANAGGVSQLDEGITEYFCRVAVKSMGIARGNYANPFLLVDKLVSHVGEKVVAEAYFDGKFGDLKSAYNAVKTSTPNAWSQYAKLFEEKKFSAVTSSQLF